MIKILLLKPAFVTTIQIIKEFVTKKFKVFIIETQ